MFKRKFVNLDSLITVAGLFVAVYAIIPRVRRLEISLSFGKFAWMILFISVISILYLQFYQTFRSLGLTPGLNLSRWSITTSNASFIILLLMSIVLYIYIKIKGLSRSNVTKFREFVFELSREKKYSELFSLIERNISQVERIYNGDYLLSNLREYFKKNSNDYLLLSDFIDSPNTQNTSKKYNFIQVFVKVRKEVFKLLVFILPSYDKEKEVAKEIVHELLINRNTVKAIAEIRPYFALQILSKDFYENHEFIGTYLRYLAEDTKSVLYHEIRNNQNLLHRDQYAIPKRNRLLSYFFEDCKIAEKYGPYKPIGEFVISYLDGLYSNKPIDSYNEPMGDFHEDGQWESELLVGIRFFDIMVTSALYQNIKWHMWLYYFPHFVERIVRNLNPNEQLIDPNDEWPTKYHYALYEITSCLCKWASSVDHIPLDQENVVLENTSLNHENGNIPKSSMLALGQVTKKILTSNTISDRFKQYIMDIVYSRYFDLKRVHATKAYAEALLNAVRLGGFRMIDVPIEYTQALLHTFESFDCIPYRTELSNELRSILTDDINNAQE